MLQLPHLASLSLAGCGAADGNFLAALLPLATRLTELDLSGCRVFGDGAAVLASLAPLTALQRLALALGVSLGKTSGQGEHDAEVQPAHIVCICVLYSLYEAGFPIFTTSERTLPGTPPRDIMQGCCRWPAASRAWI